MLDFVIALHVYYYYVCIGDVSLGVSSELVVAWWGHPTHPLCLGSGHSINTIVTHPEEEDTMVSNHSSGWISYIIKANECSVAEIFSSAG